MVLMLMVVLCYTICSLSDKYAVAKIKFNGNELTFLMAAATALFMTFTLPFVDNPCDMGDSGSGGNPAADGIQDAGVSDVCFDPAGYVRI